MMNNVIKENLVSLQNLITHFEQKYDRTPGSVQLLAASKHQSIIKMTDAVQAGQYLFGENYLQEALLKMNVLTKYPIEWHFIGPIQTNKTRKIAEHFNWVHSVDSMKIAKRLNDQRPSVLPPLNICIEVNVSHEKTKSGVDVEDVLSLVQYCLTLPRLQLRGLMTIPEPHQNFKKQRDEFQKLHTVFQSLRERGFSLDTLSMGMSDDFEAAIAEGATIVRIGTALFGERKMKKD